jgi:Icc-related predicted phosphoesterase
MKICHASDLHGDWSPLFEITNTPDVFVFTGDMHYNVPDNGFSRNHVDEAMGQIEDFGKLIHKLRKVIGKTPVVCVSGNHDYIELGKELASNGFNAIHVNTSAQTIPGTEITVAGFPNVNYISGSWNHESDIATMCNVANAALDSDPDWLITHTPPSGILGGHHKGCDTITNRLAYSQNKLKAHMFGHVHESAGTHMEMGILFSNAATQINWLDLP